MTTHSLGMSPDALARCATLVQSGIVNRRPFMDTRDDGLILHDVEFVEVVRINEQIWIMGDEHFSPISVDIDIPGTNVGILVTLDYTGKASTGRAGYSCPIVTDFGGWWPSNWGSVIWGPKTRHEVVTIAERDIIWKRVGHLLRV